MLVIKVELWPHGDEAKARELERGYITNDLTAKGAPATGNYRVTLERRRGEGPEGTYDGYLAEMPRIADVWPLVREALADAVPERRGLGE